MAVGGKPAPRERSPLFKPERSWLERVKSIINGKDDEKDEPLVLSPDYEHLYETLEQHKDDVDAAGNGWYDDPDAPKPRPTPALPDSSLISTLRGDTWETINEARRQIAAQQALEDDIVLALKKTKEAVAFERLVDKTYGIMKAANLPQTREQVRADLLKRMEQRGNK